MHSHTTHSDGRESVAEVFAQAKLAGLDVLAITDHDTVAGWAEAAELVPQTGVGLVRGIEVTTQAQTNGHSFSVHLLAYLPDPNNGALARMLAHTVVAREERLRAITDLISADWALSWEEVQAQLKDGATMGRPAVADALIAAGHFANRGEVFREVLYTGSPYYVRNDSAPDVFEAIEVVRNAGGVPVIAHPFGRSSGNKPKPETHFRELIEAGLAGFEVYHRDVPEEARVWLLGLAERYDLVVTGSSDYHGLAGKENRLGENLTSPEMLERIAEQGVLDVIYA